MPTLKPGTIGSIKMSSGGRGSHRLHRARVEVIRTTSAGTIVARMLETCGAWAEGETIHLKGYEFCPATETKGSVSLPPESAAPHDADPFDGASGDDSLLPR
jgi:hypothetical protein